MLKSNIIRSAGFWSIVSFVSYFVIGLIIYKDYGISWDERIQRLNVGLATYNYIVDGDESLFANIEKHYGPVFETFLAAMEKTLLLKDTRDIFLMRHLFTFLFFYTSVIVFFFLCRKLFGSTTMGLFACLMLVICPHIFAHSFYNSKDIPFLSFFIFSISTLFFFLEKKTLALLILHSIVTALLIDTRILGLLVPVLTIVMMMAGFFIRKNISGKKEIKMAGIYVVLTILFIYCFWPLLWPDPLKNFVEAFGAMKKFVQYDSTVLYMGEYIPANAIPWHYIPVWMGITIPVVYIVLFIIGIIVLAGRFFKLPFREFYFSNGFIVSVLALFFVPVILVIILHSILYDAWRHLFFIYPLLLILAVYGLQNILAIIVKPVIRKIIISVVCISFLPVIYFMINDHPFQNVYFNRITGNMAAVKENFELDYWGLSYKNGLEYILKTDSSKHIRYNSANDPGILNLMIIPEHQRKRLEYVNDIANCDYFLTNYRWHKQEYAFKNEYYSIRVRGEKIMSIFKFKN